MLIDWFTVIAQAINFLVLMWLMKRFLFKPVLNAIDAREAHIVETVKNAEDQQEAARHEREVYARKNDEFDRQHADLINRAREDARVAGEQMLERERLAAEASRDKWRSALEEERGRFGEEMARRAQDEIFAIVRQVLSDLADEPLEERMVEVFDRRLREEWTKQDDDLAETLRAARGTVRVKSAFDLSETQQAFLRHTLYELFVANTDIVFETDARLIGGIELIVDGRRVAWTVEDYLDRLKGGVAPAPGGASPYRTA